MSNPKAPTEKSTPWSKLGIATTPISAIHDLLDILWAHDQKITVCLIGDTGIGKTPIVHQWVKKRNGFLRTINFGHMSQEDVSMCMFTEKADMYTNVPPEWLVELNKKAEETGCAVLFLDEWNRGEKALVNALFTLTDERRIHQFTLHKDVLVVAAMNPSDGTYLVNSAERDHAIRKRLNFVYTLHDLAGWLRHAREEKYHKYVIGYVQATPTHFYDVAARDAGKTFACPANWEKVSNILKAADKLGKNLATDTSVMTLVKGQIGHTVGDLFLQYVANKDTIIAPGDVLFNYQTQRQRIARLLGQKIVDGRFVPDTELDGTIRADTVTNLNNSIAMTIFSEKPDLEKFAENLARYLTDLPDELLMQFFSQDMKTHAALNEKSGSRAFTRQINDQLKQYEPYRLKTVAMANRMADQAEILKKTGSGR